MKSTKIIIGIIAISFMIAGASANPINWNSFDIASQDGEYGIIEFTPNSGETGITIDGNGNTIKPTGDHTYQKGTLTIPIDQIQKPESQESAYIYEWDIGAYQYEDIEITSIPPIPPIEAPEQQRFGRITIDHF